MKSRGSCSGSGKIGVNLLISLIFIHHSKCLSFQASFIHSHASDNLRECHSRNQIQTFFCSFRSYLGFRILLKDSLTAGAQDWTKDLCMVGATTPHLKQPRSSIPVADKWRGQCGVFTWQMLRLIIFGFLVTCNDMCVCLLIIDIYRWDPFLVRCYPDLVRILLCKLDARTFNFLVRREAIWLECVLGPPWGEVEGGWTFNKTPKLI